MSIYNSLLTASGAAKYAYNEANALATVLSHVDLGDNNGVFFTPSINDGVINNRVYLASINSITVDPIDSTIDNVEVVLPYSVGGWTIREFRILDNSGTVMYTGNCEISKSILSSGQAIETQIIFPIKRVNAASVTLNFDPANLATFQYVTNSINTHNSDPNAHGAANWATKVGVQNQQYSYAVASGTTTAYTAAFSPAITELVDGTQIEINTLSVGTNSNETPTFAPNAITARTIVKQDGRALEIGDIPTRAILSYNLANTQWLLLNPVKGQAEVINQATAEAGTDTNIFAWTALRIRQSVAKGLVFNKGTNTFFLKLPDYLGGLILQGGLANFTVGAGTVNVFPLAFTSKLYGIVYGNTGADGLSTFVSTTSSILSQFVCTGSSSTGNYYYLAVGY